MKRSRLHMLIFLGLICAGFSYDFDDPVKELAMPAIYCLLAWMAIRYKRAERARLPQIEGLLLFFSIPLSYYASQVLEWGPHPLIFVANALCIYQFFRLHYPMNDRERRYAFVVAIIHLSVGTFVIVDWKFVVILTTSVFLLPAALREVEGSGFPASIQAPTPRRWPRLLQSGLISLIMTAFFIAFPRSRRLSPYIRPPVGIPQPTEKTDITDSTGEGSHRLLFKIEGKDIGYLRTHAFDQFDGKTWSSSNWVRVQDTTRNLWEAITPETRRRTVTVVNHRALGSFFPADGYPVRLDAPTFRRIFVARHGGILVRGQHQRPFTYRFWSRKKPAKIAPLDSRRRANYLNPGFTPSAALQQWLDNVVGGETDPYEIARIIEDRFQQNDFTYEIGIPKLDEDNPVADFVLNQKRGHCSRYAGVMTALLRLKGIPSRMVVGYVPQEYNELGGFHNVRESHAHAWTEAWIADKGWVEFDATPYGETPPSTHPALSTTVLEWVEYVWYSKIVEFDSQEQADVLDSMSALMVHGFSLMKSARVLILLIPILTAIVLVLRFLLAIAGARPKQRSREHDLREANHFYAQMQGFLSKRNLHRQPGQTPLEFLPIIRTQLPELAEPIETVTYIFCDIRYGERVYTEEMRTRVEQGLKTIARTLSQGKIIQAKTTASSPPGTLR